MSTVRSVRLSGGEVEVERWRRRVDLACRRAVDGFLVGTAEKAGMSHKYSFRAVVIYGATSKGCFFAVWRDQSIRVQLE